MFNDIFIHRFDSSDNTIQQIKVPIRYAPLQTYIARMRDDPVLERAFNAYLPSMAFEITGMSYNPSRKLSNDKNLEIDFDDPYRLRTQYKPVPYDITFDLHILTKNNDDSYQIVEQILPYFTPNFTQSVKVIPEMNLKKDIITSMTGQSIQTIQNDSDMKETEAILQTLSFTMQAFYFGPVSPVGIIKRVQVDLMSVKGAPITFEDIQTHGRNHRIVVKPGLTANGQPTSNASLSIPYQQITANDDYGFITERYFYVDDLKYDPKSGTDKPIKK